MIGGEPGGGGWAAKSATTASIDGAVGVVPSGDWDWINPVIVDALFSARGTVARCGQGASSENTAAPKYTCCSSCFTTPCGPTSASVSAA
jgi:hypothetical protein